MNIINHGVIEGRRPTDFVAGEAVGALLYEVKNESGDWTPFMPVGEWQGNSKADSMSCVTFSALNSIEAQEKLLTGKQINYSDRWIAKMSGTTSDGNYLWKVADTIRKFGLVKEESYPAPSSYTFAEYHKEIPQELMDKLLAEGQEWLKTHTISYEWIPSSKEAFMFHLKQAPLQVVIPGHAIVGINQVADITKYFDSYNPYFKQIAKNQISDALKIVLTIKESKTMKLVKDKGTVYIVSGNNDKRKIGIADEATLGLFGDEEQEEMDTSNIPEYQTISKGFVINNK